MSNGHNKINQVFFGEGWLSCHRALNHRLYHLNLYLSRGDCSHIVLDAILNERL